MTRLFRRARASAILVLAMLAAGTNAFAQEHEDSLQQSETAELTELREKAAAPVIEQYGALLRAENAADEAEAILDQIEAAEGASKDGSPRPNSVKRILAQELALFGYTSEHLTALKERGVDIPALMLKPPTGLDLSERAALSEVVVTAEVADAYDAVEPGDGFRSSVVLKVEEVLKGDVPLDNLVIRRLTGPDPTGGATVPGEFEGEPGKTYLFFLSKATYNYAVEFPGFGTAPVRERIPEEELVPNFLTLYTPVPLEDLGEGALEEVRRVGDLIEAIRP